jgi:hypothetical protein
MEIVLAANGGGADYQWNPIFSEGEVIKKTNFFLQLFGRFNKTSNFAVPFERTTREFSSAGSEHLPYKQRVGGSNPSTPTKSLKEIWGFFYAQALLMLDFCDHRFIPRALAKLLSATLP